MDQVMNFIEPAKQFAKDSIRLVNRCTKPDRKEFKKIAIATSIGFAIMGFIGFFVKLIHIPINNIIVGMTANLFFGYMTPSKLNYIVSAAIFASTIYFLWIKFKKNNRVLHKGDLTSDSKKKELDAKNVSNLSQNIIDTESEANDIMTTAHYRKDKEPLTDVIEELNEEIHNMTSANLNQTDYVEDLESTLPETTKNNSDQSFSSESNIQNINTKSESIDDSLEMLCEQLKYININSSINHDLSISGLEKLNIEYIEDISVDLTSQQDEVVVGYNSSFIEKNVDCDEREVKTNLEDLVDNDIEMKVKRTDSENGLLSKEKLINVCNQNDECIVDNEEILKSDNYIDEKSTVQGKDKLDLCDIEKSIEVDEKKINESVNIDKINENVVIVESLNINENFNDQIENSNDIEEGEIIDETFIEENTEKHDSQIVYIEQVKEIDEKNVKKVLEEEREYCEDIEIEVEKKETETINESINIKCSENVNEHKDVNFCKETDQEIEIVNDNIEWKTVQYENINNSEKIKEIKEREEGEICEDSFIDQNSNINENYRNVNGESVEQEMVVGNESYIEIKNNQGDEQSAKFEEIETSVDIEGEIVEKSFINESSEKINEDKVDISLKMNDEEHIENLNDNLEKKEEEVISQKREVTLDQNDTIEQVFTEKLENSYEIKEIHEEIQENKVTVEQDSDKIEEINDRPINEENPEVEELGKLVETSDDVETEMKIFTNGLEKIQDESCDGDQGILIENKLAESIEVEEKGNVLIDGDSERTDSFETVEKTFESVEKDEIDIVLQQYCDSNDAHNPEMESNQLSKEIAQNGNQCDNHSSKDEIDSGSDSQESDYLNDRLIADENLIEYIEECLNDKESDTNSLVNHVDDAESYGKHENWPNDDDYLDNIKRDFYDMQITICSPNSSSESDHAHCMNNLTERVAILSAESILDGQAQANSSDSEITATVSSTSRDDCSPELYVEKITCGGKELDIVYFDEAVLEEGGVQTDAKIVRTIPVGLGGRIIGKKGKTKNELMKKFGAKLLIYNHPVEVGMQVLEITCKPSLSEEMEAWVNKTLDQITKNTIQTTVSNPEWLKPMIPLGKMVVAHVIDMPTMEHVKLRIFEPQIIKQFNKMQIDMNADYGTVDNNALLPRPVAVGCVCVAMIRPDCFLRAQIVEIYDDLVWVYLFDIGKVCQTYMFYLFKIREKYMRVPFQVIPARLPHALLKNNSVTPNSIYKRFLFDNVTMKPKMVRVFFPRMSSCCVPCANIYIPISGVGPESSKSDEEFVDLLELLVSIDVCTMVRETVNSEFQMELNRNHFRNFLNDKQRKQLASSQVPVYFQPCNGKFYEEFIDFQLDNENKNV